MASKFVVDRSLITISFINFLANTGYGMIAPFLPVELAALGIDSSMFGYLFGAYSVAIIVVSPVIGVILKKFNRRRFVFMIGLILYAVGMFGYAYTPLVIKDNRLLFAVMVILRVIQGMASSSIQTTCFSISSLLYPHH